MTPADGPSPSGHPLWAQKLYSVVRTRGSSPPGSSRRAGGYSPVLRLTADEMSLPFIPLSQKVHLLGHDSTAEGDILGQGSAPARSRTPQGRFPPARLLHPGGRCGTGGNGQRSSCSPAATRRVNSGGRSRRCLRGLLATQISVRLRCPTWSRSWS